MFLQKLARVIWMIQKVANMWLLVVKTDIFFLLL